MGIGCCPRLSGKSFRNGRHLSGCPVEPKGNDRGHHPISSFVAEDESRQNLFAVVVPAQLSRSSFLSAPADSPGLSALFVGRRRSLRSCSISAFTFWNIFLSFFASPPPDVIVFSFQNQYLSVSAHQRASERTFQVALSAITLISP